MNYNLARLLLCGVFCAAAMNTAQAQTPDTPINLSVTISKTEKIWRGLRKLPVEEVEELMNEIRQQVATQTQPKPVAPSTTEDSKEKKDVPTPSKSPD